MGRILASCNQKGGVGKTTTAINAATYLAASGASVLLVDMDPQGNATSGLGIDKETLDLDVYHAIVDQVPVIEVIRKNVLQNLDVLPATRRLAGAEVELVDVPEREYRLKGILKPLQEHYDLILIDCPPALSLLTINALTVADGAIIPMQCEFYALEGLSHLVKTIELIQERLNPALRIFGILLTMFDSRTLLSQQVAGETRKHFGNRVFETVIPRNVRLAEAPSFGQPVLLYDPSSMGAKAYEQLAREMREQLRVGATVKT